MGEISQPGTEPVAWTFRAKIQIQPRVPNDSPMTITVAEIRETSVWERFAFDARRKAAQNLGVHPDELEHVK